MSPQFAPETHLVQLCNSDTVLISRNMLRYNIHGDLCKKKICADSCGRSDTRGVKDIQYDFHCEIMSRQFICEQVVRDVHENLVNRVHYDVLGCDVFQIDTVDTGTVFHVISHPRRSYQIVYLQGRVGSQFGKKTRFSGKTVAWSIMQPPTVRLSYLLNDLKQTCSTGNAVCLEGGGHCQTDRLVGSAFIRHNKICVQRVKPSFSAFNGGIEALQIYGYVCAPFHIHHPNPFSCLVFKSVYSP